ncbi:glycogen-binding subunit 76A-like [Ornithodoros turicata]|uniref:glycogen-binding subunit 76A-like n=1 Tax=Ornithodoros turicata TaxID=34597 RepID=UPI0031388941
MSQESRCVEWHFSCALLSLASCRLRAESLARQQCALRAPSMDDESSAAVVSRPPPASSSAGAVPPPLLNGHACRDSPPPNFLVRTGRALYARFASLLQEQGVDCGGFCDSEHTSPPSEENTPRKVPSIVTQDFPYPVAKDLVRPPLRKDDSSSSDLAVADDSFEDAPDGAAEEFKDENVPVAQDDVEPVVPDADFAPPFTPPLLDTGVGREYFSAALQDIVVDLPIGDTGIDSLESPSAELLEVEYVPLHDGALPRLPPLELETHGGLDFSIESSIPSQTDLSSSSETSTPPIVPSSLLDSDTSPYAELSSPPALDSSSTSAPEAAPPKPTDDTPKPDTGEEEAKPVASPTEQAKTTTEEVPVPPAEAAPAPATPMPSSDVPSFEITPVGDKPQREPFKKSRRFSRHKFSDPNDKSKMVSHIRVVDAEEDFREQLRAAAGLSSPEKAPTIVTSEDEDSGERTPLIRSTSLKTGKTPPGTPYKKKIVRFADALGLDLAAVRTIVSEDLPNVPQSAFAQLDVHGGKTRFVSGSGLDLMDTDEQVSTGTFVPAFEQPGAMPDFWTRLRNQRVCLESVVPSGATAHAVIRVMNVAFEKLVVLRYTTDAWTSFTDIRATFLPSSSDGFSDRFAADIKLNNPTAGMTLQMCVKYVVGGVEYWDSNSGANYSMEYQEKQKEINVEMTPLMKYF